MGLDERRAVRAERFFERHLRHVKTSQWAGKRFILEPFQRDVIRELFGTVGGDGLRQYREALIGLPRKNGKSEIASGIALYLLLMDGEYGAEVYSLAGSRAQAGIVFKTACDMVRASPALNSLCRIYPGAKVIEVKESNSIYRALAADADLQHGLNPSGAIIDEYHVHRNSEQYEAMATGTAARREPLIVTITTAGPGQRGPAWDLYQRALAGDPRMMHRWVGAPDDADRDDPKVWRAANLASWVTDEYLEDQHRKLPPNVFDRLHLNRWPATSAEQWVTRAQWAACDGKPQIDPDLPVYVGIDAAPKRDKTAVVLTQPRDGVHHVRCWVFEADPMQGYLDFSVVEQLVRDLYRDLNVQRVVVDPYAMIRSMMLLAEEGMPVEDFPQVHSRMVPASMALHAAIVEGRVRHGGDPDLTSAVLGSTAREVGGGWRIAKVPGTVNDAAVALAMAVRIAEQDDGGVSPRVITV